MRVKKGHGWFAPALIALVAVLLLVPSIARAAEETDSVTLTSDGGELTSGDYILEDDVTLATNLTVPEGVEVTLDLNGHALTGTNEGSTITVAGALTITDSSSDGSGTLTGTSEDSGGAIYVSGGTLTLEGGTVSGTSGNYGGGIYVENGTLTIMGGAISNSTAVTGGGVYLSASTFTMSGGEISNNSSSKYGGGLYALRSSTLTMSGGEVSGNTTLYSGGGMSVVSSTFYLQGGSITGNKALANDSTTSFVGNGGGLFLKADAVFEMSGGTISDNQSSAYGGGIYAEGCESFVISDGTISGNKCDYTLSGKSDISSWYNVGGGIYITSGDSAAQITGGTISDNYTADYGGGIGFGSSSTLIVSGGSITNNSATEYGGGIYAQGALTVSDGEISNNTASDLGGGIYAVGSSSNNVITITGGSITSNSADLGGGIYIKSNRAQIEFSGGEISGNTASSGGGVYLNKGSFTMSGGTLANNTATSKADDIFCNEDAELSLAGGNADVTYEADELGLSVDGWYEDTADARYIDAENPTEVTDIEEETTYCLTAAHGAYHSVTFTDGVDDEVVFEDTILYATDGDSVPEFTPERDGYSFDGWSTDGETTLDLTDITVTEDVTYIAVWSCNHDEYSSEVTTEATCTEDGVTTYTCTTCGDTYTETIDATGHAYDYTSITWTWTDDYSSATATVTCANDSSHTLTADATVTSETTDATCEEAGSITYTATITDDESNSYTDTQTVTIEALGHSLTKTDQVDATCTEDGTEAYWTCSTCNKLFSDEEGTTEITEPVTISATDHTYESVVTDPTCTEAGYTTYTCSVCGDTYTADETEALGHTEAEAVTENEVAATETEDGSYDSVVYCSVCGAELSRETIVVPATGTSEGEDDFTVENDSTVEDEGEVEYIAILRLYNPYTGEHLYTIDTNELAVLTVLGWNDEGIAWYAPTTGTTIYRLYNPYSGDHLYTTDENEVSVLTELGWELDDVKLYSADAEEEGAIAVYRLFNPYEEVGTHLYTTDENEVSVLTELGWEYEGIAFYGVIVEE